MKKFFFASKKCALAWLLASLIGNTSGAHAENIQFPTDAGAINIVNYGIDVSDNENDDTDAIQRAISDHIDQNKIIFFSNGTYNISKTLIWKQSGSGGPGTGNFKPFLSIQGQSRDGVVFKLKDSSPGFTDANAYKPVIETGYIDVYNNTSFANSIRNLTIDIGLGNAGAIGIRYRVSNQGTISDVKIRSRSATSGQFGIDLTQPEPGPGLLRNIEVEGFRVGIAFARSQYGMTLENIVLSGQRDHGIYNNANSLSIRNLRSNNSVEAVRSDDGLGLVVLIDSILSGGSAGASAINYRGHLLLRNVNVSGYGSSTYQLDERTSSAPGYVAELTSSAPKELFPSSGKTLNLPVEETPQFNNEDLTKWVKVSTDNNDITQALRDAISTANANGYDTIYVPWTTSRDRFRISDSVSVSGGIRRITFMGQTIRAAGALVSDGADRAVFDIRVNGPDITFDSVVLDFANNNNCFTWFDQNTAQTVVLRSVLGFGGNIYRNSTGGGKLFLEDIAGGGLKITGGQRVWARQLNCEANFPDAVDDGGSATNVLNQSSSLWILGYKGERETTAITTRGGGQTEMLGGHHYPARSVPSTNAAFVVDESRASFSYVTTAYGSGQDFAVQVRETRGGQTQEFGGAASALSNRALGRGLGSAIPFFSASGGSSPVGSITREYWTGIAGTSISDIPTNTSPTGTDVLTRLEGPTDWADNYGTRVRGYIVAPSSGTYTFWLATDDDGELWLSTNDDPANRQRIAYVNGWTDSRQWDKYSSQRSSGVALSAGQSYYVEVLQKEGAGGDNLAVGWSKPGQSTAAPGEVVPGSVLSPYIPTGGSANVASNPSFDEDGVGTQTPVGWSEWSANGSQTGVSYTESGGGGGAARTGVYRGVHWNSSAWNQVNTYQLKTGLANGRYVFSAWVKANASIGFLYVGLHNSSADYTTREIPQTETWTQLSMIVEVTNGQCQFGIASAGSGNQWIAFDDVSFTRQ